MVARVLQNDVLNARRNDVPLGATLDIVERNLELIERDPYDVLRLLIYRAAEVLGSGELDEARARMELAASMRRSQSANALQPITVPDPAMLNRVVTVIEQCIDQRFAAADAPVFQATGRRRVGSVSGDRPMLLFLLVIPEEGVDVVRQLARSNSTAPYALLRRAPSSDEAYLAVHGPTSEISCLITMELNDEVAAALRNTEDARLQGCGVISGVCASMEEAREIRDLFRDGDGADALQRMAPLDVASFSL